MRIRRTFHGWVVAATGLVACGGPAEQPDPAASAEHPRWATHFHWESNGEVLVLEGGIRVAHTARHAADWVVEEGAQIATWSTTHVSLLEAYGGLSHWAGGTSCEYVQSEAALARIHSAVATDYGNDVGHALEQLHRHPPGAITVFPFYDAFEGAVLPEGLPVLPITEYLESHPLGRAEWMRAFGWLTGQRAQADSAFAEVERRYLAWSGMKPTRSWKVLTGSIDGDAFWAPSGNSFIAQFLEDAGVDYVFADRAAAGSIPVGFEELIALNGEVDSWGVVWNDPDSLTWEDVSKAHPVYAAMKPKSGAVFMANTRTCDYFGALVAAPDVLLANLVDLFHGEGEVPGCFQWVKVP